MQSDREARIRERAYQIWVAEGRAHGSQEAHWHRAEREIAAEESAQAGVRPAPTGAVAAAGDGKSGTKSVPARKQGVLPRPARGKSPALKSTATTKAAAPTTPHRTRKRVSGASEP